MKVSTVSSVERKQNVDHVAIQPMAKDFSLLVKNVADCGGQLVSFRGTTELEGVGEREGEGEDVVRVGDGAIQLVFGYLRKKYLHNRRNYLILYM